jgi:hypothetical protein
MVFSPRVVPIRGFDFGAGGGTNGAADLLVTAIYLFYSSPAIMTINLEKMAHLPFHGQDWKALSGVFWKTGCLGNERKLPPT